MVDSYEAYMTTYKTITATTSWKAPFVWPGSDEHKRAQERAAEMLRRKEQEAKAKAVEALTRARRIAMENAKATNPLYADTPDDIAGF